MKEDFEVSEGEYGPRVCFSHWSDEVAEFVEQNNVKEFAIQGAGDNVEFLAQVPDLEWFALRDFHIKDLSPVHHLHKLKFLSLTTNSKTKIDFSQFPFLEDCGIIWKANSKSLFGCTTLRVLSLDGYKGHDTELFSTLVNLEKLGIYNSPIHNLTGLRKLNKLRDLHLANLRMLESLEGIEDLVGLEKLDIDTCRKVRSIDQVAELANLRRFGLKNCGEIYTLGPMKNLKELERFIFWETTIIQDGDLSVLMNLPKLESVAFQQRKHYSHNRAAFREAGITA
ncbi:MAG: hypothetical protein KJ993_13935 [Actinobacteria bacterium]|nr:hypothetical protein [Actinomycetota bacterium]MBU1950052.1 hypothetical protein [Candidatus Eisenbacteria bacterium]